MSKFYNYLNESINKERYSKYFESGEVTDTLTKVSKGKTIFLLDNNLNKTDISVSNDESITILNINTKTKKTNKGNDQYFVKILYKGFPYYINVNNIITPQKFSRGESLGIQATKLIESGQNASEDIVLWGKIYPSSDFKEFKTSKDLANTIINGFNNNNKVPNNVADEMERILTSGKYSSFKWKNITLQTHKNQIGKYYGELLVGLCLLNKEYNAFNGDISGMLNGGKVESFLMPISPSFPAADSIIKTDKGIIPISNKKGGGTGASFYTNLVPLLKDYSDNDLKTKSNILIQLKQIFNKFNNNQVLQQIYEWGFTYLLNNVKIKSNVFDIYKIILKKDLPNKDIDGIIEHINSKKWNNIERKHLKAVKDNLPFSLTHFFLYHLYYILSNDEKAKDIILMILGAKSYWQADLQNKPWNNGEVIFNLKKSNETKLLFSPTRGAINDIKSSHAKLNYILK